ncbi:hypothetical protein ACHQM5_016115 [Ranunculus cassubicifolius]
MNPTAAEVHYISKDIIYPATYSDSTQRLELTPWDLGLLAVNAIQKGLLFNSKPTHSTWLTDLKTSLSTALDHFYLLAGRLAIETNEEDDTVSIFIKCNNHGAEFIHATADITVSDITTPVHVPRIVHEFFPLNDSINYDGSGAQPLLSVQITELIDGVFIGFTMNHMIADGSSYWHFINSWSEICASKSSQIQRAPILKRWFLNKTDSPVHIPLSTIQNSIRSYSLPPLQERILHFAPHNIAKLKQKAFLEINNNTMRLSSLQAVLAYVWIGVTKARNLDSEQIVQYRMLMGNRARLSPPLADEYFGNSVISGLATAKVGELLNGGIGFAASLLNEAVSLHTNEKICTAWENFMKGPRFIISPRFNIYGNDFGWGRPIAVRSGCGNKYDGKMTVYPGAVPGSIEIEACLSPETMKVLGDDNDFFEFIGAT